MSGATNLIKIKIVVKIVVGVEIVNPNGLMVLEDMLVVVTQVVVFILQPKMNYLPHHVIAIKVYWYHANRCLWWLAMIK